MTRYLLKPNLTTSFLSMTNSLRNKKINCSSKMTKRKNSTSQKSKNWKRNSVKQYLQLVQSKLKITESYKMTLNLRTWMDRTMFQFDACNQSSSLKKLIPLKLRKTNNRLINNYQKKKRPFKHKKLSKKFLRGLECCFENYLHQNTTQTPGHKKFKLILNTEYTF